MAVWHASCTRYGMTVPSFRASSLTVDVCAEQRRVEPDDVLHCPLSELVVLHYARDRLGALELRLRYGTTEISFDEPDLFAFGEALGRAQRFVAREAMAWSEGLGWARVQGLLDQLLEEGVLQFAPAAG
jgi:hypothetical protein